MSKQKVNLGEFLSGGSSQADVSHLPSSSSDFKSSGNNFSYGNRDRTGGSSYGNRLANRYGDDAPRDANNWRDGGRSSGFDRAPREERSFGSDRPPREERTFSRDDFGTSSNNSSRQERSFRNDRPPREERTFSRDDFGTNVNTREERSFRNDRPPREERTFSRDDFGSNMNTNTTSSRPQRPRADERVLSRDVFGTAPTPTPTSNTNTNIKEKNVEVVDADGFIQVRGTTKVEAPKTEQKKVTKVNKVVSRFDIESDDEVETLVENVAALNIKPVEAPKTVEVEAPKVVEVEAPKVVEVEAPKVATPKVIEPVPAPVEEVPVVAVAPQGTPLEQTMAGFPASISMGMLKKGLNKFLPIDSTQSTMLSKSLALSINEGSFLAFDVLSTLKKIVGDFYMKKAKADGNNADAAKVEGQDIACNIVFGALVETNSKYGEEAVRNIVSDASEVVEYLPSATRDLDISKRAIACDHALIAAGLAFLAVGSGEEEAESPAVKIANAYASGVSNAVEAVKTYLSTESNKVIVITHIVEALFAKNPEDREQYKNIFVALVDSKTLDISDIVTWKDDVNNKSEAKQNALMSASAWISNTAPNKYAVYEDDEDEEEDDYGLGDL